MKTGCKWAWGPAASGRKPAILLQGPLTPHSGPSGFNDSRASSREVILVVAVERLGYLGQNHLIDQVKFGISAMFAKDHGLRC